MPRVTIPIGPPDPAYARTLDALNLGVAGKSFSYHAAGSFVKPQLCACCGHDTPLEMKTGCVHVSNNGISTSFDLCEQCDLHDTTWRNGQHNDLAKFLFWILGIPTFLVLLMIHGRGFGRTTLILSIVVFSADVVAAAALLWRGSHFENKAKSMLGPDCSKRFVRPVRLKTAGSSRGMLQFDCENDRFARVLARINNGSVG